jgi:hypothetical protein
MKYSLIILFSLLSVIFSSGTLFSQQKGSFEKSIKFQGQLRVIAYYVPDNYISTNSYPLIIGMHCGGCDGVSMRNMIRPIATALGAVLVCPDDPDYNGSIIPTVLNTAKQNYNIDSKKIIITGYSMGGTATFHYGFENSSTLAGIIGVAPAVSNYSSLDYNVTKSFPVGIIVGSDDDFIDVDQEIMQNINNVNGKLKYIEKPNVEHMDPYFSTNEFKNDWIACYNYINSSQTNVNDYINNENVSVIPNPIINEARISLTDLSSNLTITLLDCFGNNVQTLYYGFNKNHLIELNLDRGKNGAGVYFLKIQNENISIFKKIVFID